MATSTKADIAAESSIRVRYEKNRSVINSAAQHLIKPFASLILKPGNAEPGGSPRLTPHKHASQLCKVVGSQIADTWIYTFENPLRPQSHTQANHKLYYFAGGGFRGVPEKEHWLLCAELGMQLPEYEVNLVSYPLAPNSPAKEALAHLERFYIAIAQKAISENARITLMGDSSGGNIALVLGHYGATEYLKNSPSGFCPVESIMAMSPAVDLRNENPDIDVVDPHDPILSRKTIEEVAEGWKGGLSFSDPRISPILADVEIFRKASIKVDGVTAGYDVLSPDAILYREKLRSAGVRGDWLEWEKQMHCFPLLFSFHVSEGTAGKDWILKVLKKNVQLGKR